jgi:CHAT domain-containing protein
MTLRASGPHWCASLVLVVAMLPAVAMALDAPPTCASRTAVRDDSASIDVLWKRIVALGETDPMAALDLLCGTLERVNRERGPRSLDAARWVQAIATPLIAYLNRFDEAEQLLQQARPILERNLGPNAPELAELHVASAWMAFRRGNLVASAEGWTAALAIREHVPGDKQVELQKVLVGLAQVRLSQRRFDEALALAERSEAILQANGETVSEAAAAIKNLMGNIALAREDFPAARDRAREQVAIELALKAAGGPDQPVTAYAMLGQALQKLNEYSEAEAALRESVRLARAPDGPLQRGALTALVQLSALLNDRGEPREALEFAQQALELGERELGADAPKLVPVLYNLAQAQRTLGDLAGALRSFRRADAIVAARSAQVYPVHVVRLRRGYAQLLEELGERSEAATQAASGETLSRGDSGLSIERAATLVVQAHILLGSDPASALGAGTEALQLYQRGLSPTHPLAIRALNGLCAQQLSADVADTPSCDEAASRLAAARYADPMLRQAVAENLAERAARQRDPVQMESLALESLAAAATLGTPDPVWRASFLMARAQQARQQPDMAIFFGKQAVDQLQQLRRPLFEVDTRLDAAFLRDKIDVYRTLANWLLDADRLDEALEVLQLMKSEERNEFLQRDEAGGVGSGARLSLSPAEQSLLERYEALLSSTGPGGEIDGLLRLRMQDRITPAERARLDELLAGQPEQETQRRAAIEGFLRDTPQGGSARRGRAVQAAALDRALRQVGPDAALAIYLLGEDQLRILVVTRRGQREFTTEFASAQRRDIGALLDGIAARRDVTELSRQLYAQLLRPVMQAAQRAGAQRVVLWPDGALRYVPFAALLEGNRYAIERHSLQLYSDVAAGPVSPANPVLAVRALGVTQAHEGFTALPAIGDELCSIVRGPVEGLEQPHEGCTAGQGGGALPGAAFADSRFTRQQFEAIMAGPREFSVLHVGTHFSLRPGNALRSYLLLGDGERMTLDRLAGTDFRGVELMTLSACQTGLGGIVMADGREVEGLSAIVQQQGVQRVVASLWRVEDRSTAMLMAAFYRRLAESPGSDAAALRRAQLDVRNHVVDGARPYAHPYFWAGFTLAASHP